MMTTSDSQSSGKAPQPQNDPVGAELISLSGVAARSSGWQAMWFALKAIEIRLRFILVLLAVFVIVGGWDTIKNYWDKWTRPMAGAVTAAGDGTEFYCPMHPKVVRPTLEPDGSIPKCPICGMPLSKRKAGEVPTLPEGIVGRVQLSPQRIQLAGIKTVELEQRPLTRKIRTVGFVSIDESRLSRIVTRFSGYVEKLYLNKSFLQVKEGEPLAEIYSPELYSAVQELLIAAENKNEYLVNIGREKLKLLGIDQREIDEVIRSRKSDYRLVIRAPRSGHVFAKTIVEGDRVEAGMMLFEVADLSVAWIEADVYEKDVAFLYNGQEIEAAIESYPGRRFKGTVALVHPHLEMTTRTNRVRFELENLDHVLRPGMYATVWLETPVQEIEPFRTLLAEQQMPTAAADDKTLIARQKICPVTGNKLGSMGKPVRANLEGQSVFLCCQSCDEHFLEQPDHYLARMQTISASGVLAVPERAVIDTGDLKVVYVEREPGLFEGVAVKLGPRAESFYPVIEGLFPGDRVAAAGAFLIDAETRLNPAASAAYFGATGSPHADHAPAATPGSSPGSSRPAPSAEPKKSTPNDLANVAKLSEPDRALATRQQNCPITGQALGSMGVPPKITLQGQDVFLCCKSCEKTAQKDADKVIQKVKGK
jgi:Cu(I)/Ag(I) efflux system membrane fusion protein